MDHETEVAAPKASADPEVDERIAAFKRGAPLPKTVTPAPKRRTEPRAPKPDTPVRTEHAREDRDASQDRDAGQD